MEIPAQAPSTTYATTNPNILRAELQLEDVRHLIGPTFEALLDCYDVEKGQFPSSIERTEGSKPNPNPRDTAIVLLAVRDSAKELIGRGSLYERYKNILDKSLAKLRELQDIDPNKVLQEKEPLEKNNTEFAPFRYREAFTCSLIVELLVSESRPSSFGKVFVEAMECILDSLTHTYPPHYAFGGASLMGTEPSAFVTYYAFRALDGIVKSMERSAHEHRVLADITGEIHTWSTDKRSRESIAFWEPKTFIKHIEDELNGLPTGIGLWAVVEAIKGKLDGTVSTGSLDADRQALANCWARDLANEIRDGATEWLKGFKSALSGAESLKERDKESPLESLPEADITKNAVSPVKKPGFVSMERVKEYRQLSGLSWKSAFFEGMLAVLKEVENAYNEAAAQTELQDLQKSLLSAADTWSRTAAITREYVVKFSKWASVELHNQLALSTIVHRTNFDPSQIAFLLWIYSEFVEEKNPRLVEKGLDVLFEAQLPDGTWPMGAPFWFDRKSQASMHIANIEIVNAVMPLIDERKLDGFRVQLERISNWVETNQRKVQRFDQPYNRPVRGWSTDKIFERDRLDVWMTACVLQFLSGYATLLQRYVTSRTLEGRYNWIDPTERWVQVIEPVLAQSWKGKWRFKETIFADYIQKFLQQGKGGKNAMILYGPPGTAKSFMARAIARELNWKLVTITPSDFVKEGIEKSENMARTLFQDMLRLRDVVVLFDEIDEMLRSRDDTKMPESLAMLRFIVPGMLPKLQDLKQYGQSSGVIVVIATNYRDRLDSAVRRRGRVDDEFAVLPPDFECRRLLLDDFLKKKKDPPGGSSRLDKASHLASLTAGWVFAELKQLVEILDWSEIDRCIAVAPDNGATDAEVRLDDDTKSTRGLNPTRFYCGRGEPARDEALAVFKICCPNWAVSDCEKYVQGVLLPKR